MITTILLEWDKFQAIQFCVLTSYTCNCLWCIKGNVSICKIYTTFSNIYTDYKLYEGRIMSGLFNDVQAYSICSINICSIIIIAESITCFNIYEAKAGITRKIKKITKMSENDMSYFWELVPSLNQLPAFLWMYIYCCFLLDPWVLLFLSPFRHGLLSIEKFRIQVRHLDLNKGENNSINKYLRKKQVGYTGELDPSLKSHYITT